MNFEIYQTILFSVFISIKKYIIMDLKRRAMEGALVPSKKPRTDIIPVGKDNSAVIQSVSSVDKFDLILFSKIHYDIR